MFKGYNKQKKNLIGGIKKGHMKELIKLMMKTSVKYMQNTSSVN